MHKLFFVTVLALTLSLLSATGAMAGAATFAATAPSQAKAGCYAEVMYTSGRSSHTYEYLCGRFRPHSGQIVVVPVLRYGTSSIQLTTAYVVRISKYRTYFGGPLRTVAGVR